MTQVILIINNSTWFGKRVHKNWISAAPIITSMLKDICDFSVIDANVNCWTCEEAEAKVRESGADIVLVSALSVDYQLQYHKTAAIAKKALPSCTVVMGGVYPTVMEEEVLSDKNIDYIFIGHAEGRLDSFIHALAAGGAKEIESFPGIGYRKKGGCIVNPLPTYIGDIKEMVRPDYSQIDIEGYLDMGGSYSPRNYSTECNDKKSVNIITSYGCRYNCFFCATRTISGTKIAYREVVDIIDEIKFFISEHNVTHISFIDDNMVSDKTIAKKLLSEIIAMGYSLEIQIGNLALWDLNEEIIILLAKAGCTRIGISIESSSQRVLRDIIHKPLDLSIVESMIAMLRENGIMITVDFIIGLPGETWREIRNTFRYAEKLDVDLCNFNIATPYPKTDMYLYMKENGLLPEGFSFMKDRAYLAGIPSTDEFKAAELLVLQAFEWEKVNCDTTVKRERTKRVLRIDDLQLDDYCRYMRESAIRCIRTME